jgi:hypothetical protein
LRLVAENESGSSQAVAASTFTTDPVAPPTASIDPVVTFTDTTAHFSGTVNPAAPLGNPSAFDVNWQFKCTPECLGPAGQVSADNSSHAVSGDVSGLEPNVNYQVTLVASNAGGSDSAGPQAFKTNPVAPIVTTRIPGTVGPTTALLGGTVDPNNAPTTYFVQYATQADFSDSLSAPASEDASAGAGGAAVTVSRQVTGLSPAVKYFYRVVATNATDTTLGNTQSFTTLPAGGAPPACPNAAFRTGPSAHLPDCRAYEKITPAEKNGGNAFTGIVFDDDQIYFPVGASFLEEDTWVGSAAYYMTSRGADAWTLRSGWQGAHTDIVNTNLDDTQDTIEGPAPLLPSDTDLKGDVYTRGPAGLRLISTGSLSGDPGEGSRYAGQSDDGSHILFETTEHLEAEDSGRTQGVQLYERVGNETRVVGLDSDGNPISDSGAVLGNGATNPIASPSGSSNAVSADGSRVFFESPDPFTFQNTQLYARINGEETIDVSASECTRQAPEPLCGEPQPVTFQGAPKDGSRVYFTTAGQLVNGDLDESIDLYEYDLEAEALTRVSGGTGGTAENAQVEGVVAFLRSGAAFTSWLSARLLREDRRGRSVYICTTELMARSSSSLTRAIP